VRSGSSLETAKIDRAFANSPGRDAAHSQLLLRQAAGRPHSLSVAALDATGSVWGYSDRRTATKVSYACNEVVGMG